MVVSLIVLALQGYFWTYFWALPAGAYDWVHISVMTVAVVFNVFITVGCLIDALTGNTSIHRYDYY